MLIKARERGGGERERAETIFLQCSKCMFSFSSNTMYMHIDIK